VTLHTLDSSVQHPAAPPSRNQPKASVGGQEAGAPLQSERGTGSDAGASGSSEIRHDYAALYALLVRTHIKLTQDRICRERLANAEREKVHAQQDAKRALLRAKGLEAAAKRELEAAQAEVALAIADQKRQEAAAEVHS